MTLLTKNNSLLLRAPTKKSFFTFEFFFDFPVCFLFFLSIVLLTPGISLVAPLFARSSVSSQTSPLKKCWENPIVAGSSVYASDKNSSLYLFTPDKKIVSINTLNGLINWSYELNSQSVSNFIVDDNSLYVANLTYKNAGDEKNNEKNNEKNLENEKLYLRSINITSGIPYWATEIYFANGETGESKSSVQTGTDENGQIILGEVADGLFMADKSGRFAFVQKKQGLPERFRTLDFKPIFFLDSDFPELNGWQKTSVAQKLFAFYAAGGIYFAVARNGEIFGYTELSESPTAGFLLDQKNFFVGDEKGNLFSFTLGNNGKWRRIWNVKVGGSISGLTPVDDNLLVTSFDNFVYFLERSNGKKIWKRRLSGRLVFKPLIAKKENRLIAIENNVAYLISLVDGKLSNQISLSPDEYFIGEPVSANNRYIFQTNQRIISFSDSDKGCS